MRFDLPFLDPRQVLTVPGALQAAVDEWPRAFGRKLTDHNRRKLTEEIIQAAAFCWGMGELWGRKVEFCPLEYEGGDALVAIHDQVGGGLIGKLQLTQWPQAERSAISLQDVINKKVGKYGDPESLYLGVAVNRPGEIDFGALAPPPELKTQVLELWIFGRLAEDRTRWFFRGDLLGDDPKTYPVHIPDILPLQ